MADAGKAYSDLQWVDEKLIRPFAKLLEAMKEAAEVQADLQGKQNSLVTMNNQHAALIKQVNAKRAELQTLERDDTAKIQSQTRRLEADHQTRLETLTREFDQLQTQHRAKVQAMEKREREVTANLERMESEYAGAHKKLEEAFRVRKTALDGEITTLERTLRTLEDRHAQFLDDVHRTVKK